jgi:hypothetical protein
MSNALPAYHAGVSDDTGDRLILAAISGAAAHHCPLSRLYPHGEDQAVSDVRQAARGRSDLLARYAGHCLGLSAVQPVDAFAAQLVAQASLAARAGADMDQVARWIEGGIATGEIASAAHRPRCRWPRRRQRTAAMPGGRLNGGWAI